MVTCDDRDRGIQFCNAWENAVQLFDAFYFFGKVAIFSGTISILEMDEEEFVFGP